MAVNGSTLDFSLQPLERESYVEEALAVPVGDPWTITNVEMTPDGSFTVDFGSRSMPAAAYPVIDETLPLSLEDFHLTGKTTSPDSFCGGIEGYVQVLPLPGERFKADVVLLNGSRFGAVRITGDTLPVPVRSCP